MRTIKFLGFAVAMAAATVSLNAQQVVVKPGDFPAIDRMARMQAQRVERWQRMQQARQFRAVKMGRFAMAGRFANAPRMNAQLARGAGWRGMGPAGLRERGMQAARMGGRAGFRAGAQAGFRAGRGAGFRAGVKAGKGAGFKAGLRANATPEQKALYQSWQKQRQDVRQQVLDGKLTREQARAQMQKWRAEHLPKK